MKLRLLGKVYKKQGKAVFVKVKKKDFMKVMEKIHRKTQGRISAITGYDNGKNIELIYTFLLEKYILNVKIEINRKNPFIQSISSLFPAAEIYERENFEMLGVRFEGNKNLKKILLDKASPKTPLRKGGKI
ncbi:MAG: hypothetical protein DRP54_05315 [Spirochaetes bacterium]|nr:MAG: hypothetical protein DRP54_05315 [Spirochaetota bacterium]